MKKMLTIKELSDRTGLSSYEIRRRVHSGTLPHMRVGAKQTKILIDENIFMQVLAKESIENMTSKSRTVGYNNDSTDTINYGELRRIE